MTVEGVSITLLLLFYRQFVSVLRLGRGGMAGWGSAFTSPVSSSSVEEAIPALQREPVSPRKGGKQRGYFWLIVPLICGGIFFALIVLSLLGQALQHPVPEQKPLIPKIDGNCLDCFACVKSPLSVWTTGIAAISLL